MFQSVNERYYSFNRFLKEKFGVKIRKVSVYAGFTCPNRDGKVGYGGCIYCYTPGFTPSNSNCRKPVGVQIEEAKSRLRKRGFKGKFLAYFQAFSNTYAPVTGFSEYYDEALKDGDVVGLAIGTRPDCVPDEVLLLLQGYAKERHVWIEYGLQSACNQTLEYINRGHTYAQFEDAVKRTQNRGIYICAHIILGLPGEDENRMYETVDRLSDLGIDGIKIHHLQVVKGTSLEEKYNEGHVKLLSVEDYVPLICNILERLSPRIVIHRLMGDIRDELLIAPRWALPKTEILASINRELERRCSCQGSYFKKEEWS